MAKNTSILLGDHLEKFISNEVDSGKYASASEVVRTALRNLEYDEKKRNVLLNALREGENSEKMEWNPKKQLEDLHKKYL